jgi:hypothetical protein
MVADPLVLPVTKDQTKMGRYHCNADGKRGSGKRVWRMFPEVPEWSGELVVHVLDSTITLDVFERHLRCAGQLIGIGRFRPRNGGHYGRFTVEKVTWKDLEL